MSKILIIARKDYLYFLGVEGEEGHAMFLKSFKERLWWVGSCSLDTGVSLAAEVVMHHSAIKIFREAFFVHLNLHLMEAKPLPMMCKWKCSYCHWVGPSASSQFGSLSPNFNHFVSKVSCNFWRDWETAPLRHWSKGRSPEKTALLYRGTPHLPPWLPSQP